MRRVITVTANPAIDLTYHVDGIAPGESHRVSAPLTKAGGKGVNVARVAHQQGHSALAIAPAGGATGEVFSAELRLSGVPHHLVPTQAETRRTITMVDTSNEETSIFNEYGSPLRAADWRALCAAVVDSVAGLGCPRPGVLVGSGSLPPNSPPDFYPTLVGLAHRAGVPALIDTSGPGIIAAAKAGADLLKPNHHELIEATGEHDLVSAALKLIRLGAQRVLVSAGADGMMAFDSKIPGSYWQARLPGPLQGNPTGAGDAAVAAAAVALASGITDMETVLRLSTSWSAAAVLMPGAGEISNRHEELAAQLAVTEKESPCP